jgi:hypothetical protein
MAEQARDAETIEVIADKGYFSTPPAPPLPGGWNWKSAYDDDNEAPAVLLLCKSSPRNGGAPQIDGRAGADARQDRATAPKPHAALR